MSGINRELIVQIIFIDESNFEVLNYHPKFCIARLQNGVGSAGIWRCISYKGTGISNIYTRQINQFV
ncbi:hypothetical protein BpHYR1_054484 [Brachionus plicatilis]|uniref:Uncharacterized protein n=1 Tax=Brachionus plicatilis TaxID=10195 RepID=A0A3M7Q1A7_BRAPC|nr:hypothetical protein BpHYR1_054484 [Brachionus plicatilis]